MNDDQVKKLRDRHVKYARDLAKAEDAKERADMQAAAEPWNPLVRLGAWLIGQGHKSFVKAEAKARADARKTYDEGT